MCLVVSACSQSVGGQAAVSESAAPDPSASAAAPTPAPSSGRSAAPAVGAPIDAVITWIEAGQPENPDSFHVAFRDGVTTQLGARVAFVAPSGPPHSTTQCTAGGGAMSCLLELSSPPPPPAQGEGMWQPGWIEFSGTGLSVGSLRGDPGPFASGTGTELSAGRSLAFGDNRCRSDVAGLYCVDYAHRSAVRIAADGVSAYGCLAEVAPPPESAAQYRC